LIDRSPALRASSVGTTLDASSLARSLRSGSSLNSSGASLRTIRSRSLLEIPAAAARSSLALLLPDALFSSSSSSLSSLLSSLSSSSSSSSRADERRREVFFDASTFFLLPFLLCFAPAELGTAMTSMSPASTSPVRSIPSRPAASNSPAALAEALADFTGLFFLPLL
jgi:hypothetical protein